MKTVRPRLRTGALMILIGCSLFTAASPAADDISTLFQQGRTAYYNGNFELARQLLLKVQAKNPGHFETNALLGQINAQTKKGDASLQKQYAAVIIPKFDVTDASLQESLQALGILAKNASEGKVQPNFIVKSPDLNQAKITLALTNVPLTEAVRYLAEMTKAKTTWDKHAVMFSSAAD